MSRLDVARIRADFPLLQQTENDRPLVYVDNAATTQKPKQVLAAIDEYYRTSNANVHRGAYTLAVRATDGEGILQEELSSPGRVDERHRQPQCAQRRWIGRAHRRGAASTARR